jgi:hypothetical protein
MASNARVLNLTNRCTIKKSQALRRIEQCISTWVVEGYEIRDLSLSERVQARSVQAQLREALPFAEIPGIRVTGIPGLHIERQLAFEATQFCLSHA